MYACISHSHTQGASLHTLPPSPSHTYITRTQDREYGIGWGHRELEFRRTVVTVESINDMGEVCFCIMGLRSRKDGYYVTLSRDQANLQAMCLDDWCQKHPEDAKP